jgi:Flp pilus assembly protein CpaB
MSVQKAKPRRGLNIKIIGVIMLGGALALGALVLGTQGTRSYRPAVASTTIAAGSPLSADEFSVDGSIAGDPPSAMVLTAESVQPLIGQLATSTIYPGQVLQTGNFFNPLAYDPTQPTQAYTTRLTQLLTKDQRGLILLGDPTSTFVQVGDYIDVYWINDTSVRKLMTKRVIYSIVRNLPASNAAGADYTPAGTSFILDLSSQEAQDLIYAQQHGQLRVSIASPDSALGVPTCETTADYFARTYKVTIPGVTPGSGSNGGLFPPTSTPAPLGTPTPAASGGVPSLPGASPTVSPVTPSAQPSVTPASC